MRHRARSSSGLLVAAALAAASLLGACASLTRDAASDASGPQPLTARQRFADPAAESSWKPFVLPGKRATRYEFTNKDGRWAIEASADRSASMLRRALDLPPRALADVTWAWWVDEPLPGADLGHAERTDAPASLVFAFDGDKSRLPARERMLFELAHALSGEEPPYATLVYAWATSTPVNTVVHSPRTERVRHIVVDTGVTETRRWREHRRNLVADFVRAFGEPPGRLIGVALMTDSDNTRAKARAWYGRIDFHPPFADGLSTERPACLLAQGSNCSSANN